MNNKIILASLLAISGVYAQDSLVKKALDAGLKPIPQNKTELYKLIDNKKRAREKTIF